MDDNKPIAPQGRAFTSQNEYLQALEELLRLNRPTRTIQTYDTGSLIPNQLVETAGIRPETITGAAPIQTGVTQEQYFRPQYNFPQYETPQIDVGMEQPMSYQEFTQGREPQGQTETTLKFLEDLARTYYDPQVQQASQTTRSGGVDQDGGYVGVDNRIHYTDGTVRNSQDTQAFAIRTNMDGSVQYSDGSVRRPKQQGEMMSVTPKFQIFQSVDPALAQQQQTFTTDSGVDINNFDEYLSLISQGRLGSKNITGRFGQYYGFEREARNIGTDIGTGRLGADQVDLFLPFNAKVLQVGRWDGLPANQTQTMYGNSVLVQLPTGHTIRFSHLSELGNIRPGQEIAGGTYLGTTGDTGYAFGQHLDHEMRDPNGQLVSSENFFDNIKSNPEVASQLVTKTTESKPPTGNIPSDVQMPTREEPMMSQETPEQRMLAQQSTAQLPQSEGEILSNQIKGLGRGLSQTIEQQQPTGANLDLGISEALRGDIAGGAKILGQTVGRGIEKIGPTLSSLGRAGAQPFLPFAIAPDIGASEALRGQPQQLGRNITRAGQAVERVGRNLRLPEYGISEALGRIGSRLTGQPEQTGQVAGAQTQMATPVNAAEMAAKPGAGVEALKTKTPELENIFKKLEPGQMGEQRKVGEETATTGEVGALAGMARTTDKADVRDPFFKAGGTQSYKEFLKPGITAQYRGALTPDLFKDAFFENPDNIANVFGNTQYAKQATERYRDVMRKQYPILPGGENPTVKKVAEGKYDDGETWRIEYEDVNPVYYENQWRKSIIDAIPSVLQSTFKFTAPRSTARTTAGKFGELASPVQGLKPQERSQSAQLAPTVKPQQNIFSSILGAIQNKFATPASRGFSIPQQFKPAPVSTPQQPSRSSYSQPASSGFSVPVQSKPQAPARSTTPGAPPRSSTPSAPSRSTPSAPPRTQAPSAPSRPATMAPPRAPTPVPKPTPAPKPQPKPQPKPAPKQASKPAPKQNIFQRVVNFFRR